MNWGNMAIERLDSKTSHDGREYTVMRATLFDHFQATGSFRYLEEALVMSKRLLALQLSGDKNNEVRRINRAITLCWHGELLAAKCQRYYDQHKVEANQLIDEAIDCGLSALKLMCGLALYMMWRSIHMIASW